MKFKKNDMVLVDPENRIRNREIEGTLTGIVINAGLFSCKVFSQQTYTIFTIPNKYLYNLEKANEADLSHVAIIRDSAPLFELSDIIELETVMSQLDDETSKDIIKKTIAKMQDRMIGNVFVEVEEAKSDSKTFNSIPSVFNYYLTEDAQEQLKQCIEARENLDAAKKAGAFDGNKAKVYKRQLETVVNLIIENFKEIVKGEPTVETFLMTFRSVISNSVPPCLRTLYSGHRSQFTIHLPS